MNRRARTILLTFLVTVFLGKTAPAQVVIQPTPNPTVTAEHESWYLNGEPITHAGNLYYPAGPMVYFNPTEMVRSGFYQGIPLFSRTTIEPYSVVYVPVRGALMQPYERPRSGTLAGTSGSVPSTVSRGLPSDISAAGQLQAAGPPSLTTTEIPVQVPRPVGTAGVEARPDVAREPAPVGTSGRVPAPRPTVRARPGRPLSPTSIFIEFDGTRWYTAGPAEPIDTTAMRRAGYYSGVPVWVKPSVDDGIIYVPVMQGGGSLAVPYSRRK
ncbi:MAG: hypothetical protein WD227_10160 [Vicinamibacterales bacterium]